MTSRESITAYGYSEFNGSCAVDMGVKIDIYDIMIPSFSDFLMFTDGLIISKETSWYYNI